MSVSFLFSFFLEFPSYLHVYGILCILLYNFISVTFKFEVQHPLLYKNIDINSGSPLNSLILGCYLFYHCFFEPMRNFTMTNIFPNRFMMAMTMLLHSIPYHKSFKVHLSVRSKWIVLHWNTFYNLLLLQLSFLIAMHH